MTQQGTRLQLLSDSQTIMEFPQAAAPAGPNPYPLTAGVLLVPLLYLLASLRRNPATAVLTRPGIGLRSPRLNYRVLGLFSLGAALVSGGYGLLMLGGWLVSAHTDLHHNLNLLLFWPTDLLGVVVALYWLTACKPWQMTHNSLPFIRYYLLARGRAWSPI